MFSREYLVAELEKYQRAEAEYLDLAKMNRGAALAIQEMLNDFDAAGEGAASAAPLIPQEVGANE
jgi:hypothetical protein